MADGETLAIGAGKFQHAAFTADGKARAAVPFSRLETLWINTGSLCNVACAHCYIDSSPKNDRLSFVTVDDIAPFLDEAEEMGAGEIGFTGGEPFMNPDMIGLARAALSRGMRTLILTNAMRPMMRPKMREGLLSLREDFASALTLRVSLDHYAAARHDEERGAGSFEETLKGLLWLARQGFAVTVAGRSLWAEDAGAMRKGFAALFAAHNIPVDAADPAALVIFPEMDARLDTPEITEDCWRILGRSPESVMCASSRMLVKRRGDKAPVIVACTLLPYEEQFELGQTLRASLSPVRLNHPHCSRFCVLGGASCSAKGQADD